MQSIVLISTTPKGITFTQETASSVDEDSLRIRDATYVFSHVTRDGVSVYHDMDTATHANVVNGRLCGCSVVVDTGSVNDMPRLWDEWTSRPSEMPPPLTYTLSNMQMSTGLITKRSSRKVVREEEPVFDIPEERCDEDEDEEDDETFDDDEDKGVDTVNE